jgi:hypothetical protein
LLASGVFLSLGYIAKANFVQLALVALSSERIDIGRMTRANNCMLAVHYRVIRGKTLFVKPHDEVALPKVIRALIYIDVRAARSLIADKDAFY